MAELTSEIMDDLQGKFLTFYIGDVVYGIELLHVIEIISVQPITRVPYLPPYIKGITNLRGKIVPVIDVRLKFKMEEKEHDEKTCIIVLNVDEKQVGIIVDRVSEVLAIQADQLAPPPDIGTSSGEQYLKWVTKMGEKVVLSIDCNKFFQNDLASPKLA